MPYINGKWQAEGYDPYKYNHGDKAAIIVASLIVILPLLICIYAFIKRLVVAHGAQIVASWAAGIFFAAVVGVGIGLVVWEGIEWFWRRYCSFDGLPITDKRQNTYNIGNNTGKQTNIFSPAPKAEKPIKPVSLLLDERTSAPRASFFGRLDGTTIEEIGKYEERWLNTFELSHWKRQKEREQALMDGLVDENLEIKVPDVQIATKIDYKV